MDSIIFTEEEARYLRALLELAERPDNGMDIWNLDDDLHFPEKDKIGLDGEFRVLVIGAEGVGKTSFINKVGFILFSQFTKLFHLPSENVSVYI